MDSGFLELGYGFQSLGFPIPQAHMFWIPECRLPYMHGVTVFSPTSALWFVFSPVSTIDLFSLHVLLFQYRSFDNTLEECFFQISSHPRVYLRIIYENTRNSIGKAKHKPKRSIKAWCLQLTTISLIYCLACCLCSSVPLARYTLPSLRIKSAPVWLLICLRFSPLLPITKPLHSLGISTNSKVWAISDFLICNSCCRGKYEGNCFASSRLPY